MECDKKTKKGIKYLSPEFIDSDDSDDNETPTPTPTNKKKRGRPSEDVKPEAKKQKISKTTIKTKKRKSTSNSAEKLNIPPAAVTTISDVGSTSTIPTVPAEKGSNSNTDSGDDTTNKKSNSSEERFKAFNVINVTRLIKLQYLTNIKLLSSKDRSTYLNQEMRTNVVLVPEENPLNAPLKKLKSVAMSSIDYNYVTVRYPAKNKFNKF